MLQPNKTASQRDRLLALLKSRERVPLPEVIAVGGAQYGARIHELRGLGYRIKSEEEGGRNWFRLITPSPAATSEPQPGNDKNSDRLLNLGSKAEQPEARSFPEFGDLTPGPRYPD
jgi:hypothetical protein